MKFIIATILAVCLVGAIAGPAAMPFEAEVHSVIEDMGHVAEDTAKTLAHQYQEIIVEPQQQLEEAVDAIEARREESDQCVTAEEAQINEILGTANEDMFSCGVVAAQTSADIATDVSHATQQLVFGGYNLQNTYRKCQSYKNSVRRKSCMTMFYIQGTVYLVNARSSIKTIKQSTNERIPAVFTDSNVCTHSASDRAVLSLNEVNSSIDACVARR